MTRTQIEFIKDQIKQTLSIKDIVEFYVGPPNTYTKRYKCPFNSDEHHCNLEVKGRYWRCFSCNKSGDEIEFVRELFSLTDYKDCLLKIAQDFNLKTTTVFDPEYQKRIDKIKKERERAKIKAEFFQRKEKEIYDLLLKRQEQLERIIKSTQPYNPKNLKRYALTRDCNLCIMSTIQYNKNNTLIDILLCNDISENDSAIYGYAITPEEKIALKKQVVRDIIDRKIKINDKGDVVSAYGYK